ncbi:MAG TPA: DUF3450 family protein [Verrucomicrobiales bacterium]|nr:DUF3450 family protein [Verrucomicrobiales bacterium]
MAPAMVSAQASGADQVAVVRANIEEWVKTTQLTAKLKADWDFEKQLLQGQKEALAADARQIAESIVSLQETEAAADADTTEVAERVAKYEAATAGLPERLRQIEDRALRAAASFPEPLRDEIGPELQILNNPERRDSIGLPARMQNLAGLLTKAERFNNSVVLETTGTRKGPDGNDVAVETLYLGLAAAYSVNQGDDMAWVGRPREGGWEFTPAPELARRIRDMVAIQRNEGEIDFVTLPVKVN